MVERNHGKVDAGSSILPSGSVECFFLNVMSQENLIRFKCGVCKRANYYSTKNKKKVERKLEFKKFCKWCKKRTTHKEAKLTG